jgi:alkanesulfonate monooxygenase SsuD/methylene tetrahydromethanopterin reductase-like flavin-dependent oxidoreductase (luciferase family)
MCEEGERLGAHSVWFTEHHMFEDGYIPQPLTFAAAAAARTSRMRIGIAILIAPLYHPVHLAEQAAVVDIVSGGRLDLGIGAGYRIPEYELFGAEHARRGALTFERARQLREIWSEGRVTPQPVQERLPIWMGVHGLKAARRTGELGEGLLWIAPGLVEPYREGLEAGGHDPASARMSGPVNALLTDDPERDWPEVSRHLAYQWDSYRRYGAEGTDLPPPAPIDPEDWRAREAESLQMRGFLFGTPEDVAAQIKSMVGDAPVETIFPWGSIAGLREELVVRNVELICTRLAPLLA